MCFKVCISWRVKLDLSFCLPLKASLLSRATAACTNESRCMRTTWRKRSSVFYNMAWEYHCSFLPLKSEAFKDAFSKIKGVITKWPSLMPAVVVKKLFLVAKRRRMVSGTRRVETVNPHHRVSAAPTTLSKKIKLLQDHKQTNKHTVWTPPKLQTSWSRYRLYKMVSTS